MKKKILLTLMVIALGIFVLGEISVSAATINTSSVSELQSAHPYSSNMDTTWVYTHPTAADSLEITFSSDTATESTYDWMYILDGNGNQIEKQSGTALAGKTVTVTGNVVKIRLTSDGSVTKNGFTVTNINAVVLSGPISDLTLATKTKDSFTFTFAKPIEATSVSLEYSIDGSTWITATTTEALTSDSETATIENIEFGVDYLYRLNVVGGKREGVSNVSAASIKYANASEFDFSNGVINKYNGTDTFIIIPETIDDVTVTSIGTSAFSGCSKITGVILPDSIKTINQSAFYNCYQLKSINIPDNVTAIGNNAFYNCSSMSKVYITDISAWCSIDFANANANPLCYINSGLYLDNILLTELIIPDSITCIKPFAFYYCNSLTSITIPEGITTIGDYAFYNCTALTKINWNAATVKAFTTNNCIFFNAGKDGSGIEVIFEDSVKSIPSYCFYPYSSSTSYCPKITSITIGENVTFIGTYAFYYSNYLTKLNWNAKSISDFSSSNYIFYYSGGYSGMDVVFGDAVEKIPAYCFYPYSSNTSYVPKINSITIGENVTSIGNYAFYYSTYLTKLNWNAKSVSDFSSKSFIFYESGKNSGIDVIFGDSVEKIPAYCFYTYNSNSSSPDYPANIKTVTIGKNINSIGESAFSDCDSLTKLYISDLAAYMNIEFTRRSSKTAYPTLYAENLYINNVLATRVEIPEGITKIADFLFYNNTNITEVILPDSVTSIGESAFEGCTSITAIPISDNVASIGDYAFKGCTGLTDITLPNSITTIESGVFSGCTGLTEVALPDSVTSIGNSAFSGCTNVEELTLPVNLTNIGRYAFYKWEGLTKINWNSKKVNNFSYDNYVFAYAGQNGDGIDVIFGEHVEYIPSYAFKPYNQTIYTPKIMSATINGTVTKIGSSAFENCTYLTDVTLPGSLNVIGNSTFSECTGITSIILPNGVTSIGDYAFRGCTGLTDIDIPDSVTSIGSYAFKNCSNLENVNLGNGIEYIGTDAFVGTKYYSNENNYSNGVMYANGIAIGCDTSTTGIVEIASGTKSIANNAFYNCKNITSIIIPDSVTSIGNSAFYGCTGLTNINIPKNVTAIENYTFYNCKNITSIIIPDNIASIGSSAFYGCTGLTSINIPDSVTSIGSSAFYGCTGLTSITIPENVASIGSSAFYNCTNLTAVYWNAETVEDFSSSNYVFALSGQNGDGINVIFGDKVKSIPAYAFYPCSTSSYNPKIIGAHVGNIEKWCRISFVNSYSNPLYLGGSLYIDNSKVAEITIPENITFIGNYVFYGYNELKSINIPGSVTSIGSSAFYGCNQLTKVNVDDIDYWYNIEFADSDSNPLKYAGKIYANGNLVTALTIPETCTEIKNYAFYGCTGITGVSISDNITEIGEFAFYGCSNITDISVPECVSLMYGSSFANCARLKTITVDEANAYYCSDEIGTLYTKNKNTLLTIPASSSQRTLEIKPGLAIDSHAIIGCNNITTFIIQDNVANIPKFEDLSSIKRFEYYGSTSWSSSVKNIISELKNCETIIMPYVNDLSYYTFACKDTLRYIEIPRVTSIPKYTFAGCKKLQTVIIDSARTIGEYAFKDCEKLQGFFAAPDSYLHIHKYAFYGCKSMTYVTISRVPYIYDYAFYGCDNLRTIYINHCWPNSYFIDDNISSNAFSGVTATIYYPETMDVYESDFQNKGGNLTIKGVKYGICGPNVYWSYNDETYTLTLTGSGSVGSYWSGNETPWCDWEKEIKHIVVGDGITELESYIFEFCRAAETVSLPNTLRYLPCNAFNDCSKLNNIIIPRSVQEFSDGLFNRCDNLTDVYYVGTEEEFNEIPNNSSITYYGQKLHYLVWNEPSATCTEAGVEGYYSFDDTSVYNTKYDTNKNVKTYLNSVPATGHNIVWMEEISANCHETGKKERFECENCGTIYTDKTGTTERTDTIIEINLNNHQGETELRDVTDGFTGNTYCLGCEQIISSGENIYKIKISGTELAIVGSTEIIKTVEVGTDKDVNALYCFIKYPDTLTLKSVTAKDFAYAELEDEYTEDGFTTAVILAQYSETELIPKNQIFTPFELTFDISKSATPGTVQIEATEESCLIGNDTYFFEERTPGSLVIEPKLTEGIEISGADIISSETTYTAIISPDYTTNKDVEWSVDNEEVATVSENGVVTPVTSGTFILTATAKDGSGVTASKTITVTRGVASIEIVGVDSITEATTYSVIITPNYATNKEVEWSISNSEIATIDQNGIVTPITSGLVTITATAKDGSGISASKEINIIKLAESIVITGEDSISSPAQYTATVLPNYTSDKEVNWSIDNEEIATVDELGIVTPVTSGKIILTATAKDGSGVISSKTIEIVKLAESIEIVGSEEITEPSQYSVVILPEYTTNKDAEWSVSDETVATVDENGVVTPIKNGKIVLTAKALDASGIETTKSIVITVSVRANSITSDIGEWDNEFDSDITEYIINVPSGTTAVYLTSSFENATAKVNGSIALNGVRKKVALTGTETNVEIVLTPMSGNNLKANIYTINVVRGAFTKTTVSEDGKSFTITPINIENGKTVILALYNGNKFVEMQSAVYTGEAIPFTTTKSYTNAKVMVWDDITNLKPVCNVEIVK